MGLPLNGIWKTGLQMPTARFAFACESVGKKIYCAGGSISTSNHRNTTNVLEVYDTETNYWVPAKPMPESLYMIGSVVVGDKIYCIGGVGPSTFSNRIYIYDTITNNWTLSPYTMPTGRGALRCSYVDGKIYCAGGIVNAGSTSWVFTNTLEILDLSTGIWTTGSPLPDKLGVGCLHHNNGRLYWISGGHTPSTINSKKTYVYDIINNIWSEGSNIPSNQIAYASVINDEKIYIISGTNFDTMKDLNLFLSYDIKNDTYINLPNAPTMRSSCQGTIIDNKLYVLGGFTNNGLSNNVEIYSEENSVIRNEHCCCGSLKLELNIPINNNVEMLEKLKELVGVAKGCDSSGCGK
ncbi:MAG: hypothetical protein KIC73_02820 [Clostridiales bacterium]|nr:hypothetical protein [Clostridiales bacterium]